MKIQVKDEKLGPRFQACRIAVQSFFHFILNTKTCRSREKMLRISCPKFEGGFLHSPYSMAPSSRFRHGVAHLSPTPPSPVFIKEVYGHGRTASYGFSFFSVSYCRPYIKACHFLPMHGNSQCYR
ncbi:hypothetical protein CDAR_120171 [Caerostris darwini]|uniref:Uncharacterized protein n=1 Tax=Caerostris darwini TaxID=1538125 RepID=A0AAV4UPT7_9ARAC|nr:hypothetical protein CDAR_120171 [Caerostris darwini]